MGVTPCFGLRVQHYPWLGNGAQRRQSSDKTRTGAWKGLGAYRQPRQVVVELAAERDTASDP